MDDLLTRWRDHTLKPPSRVHTSSSTHERISEELSILEPLLAKGCLQIPDEEKDVPTMIQERRRLLQMLQSRASKHTR